MNHLWGYPLTITVEVDGEPVDISSALTIEYGKPSDQAIRVDGEKVLDLIDAHQRNIYYICTHEFAYSGRLLSCRKCGKVFP